MVSSLGTSRFFLLSLCSDGSAYSGLFSSQKYGNAVRSSVPACSSCRMRSWSTTATQKTISSVSGRVMVELM